MSWPFGRKQENKSPFEATMPLDTDEMKIVEARFNGAPIFFGVGKATEINSQVGAKLNVTQMAGAADVKKERVYVWDYFYNPKNMPGFLPIDKASEFMVGTVSLVSGNISSSSTPKPVTSDIEVSSKAGISPEGTFFIVDGQHRLAASKEKSKSE